MSSVGENIVLDENVELVERVKKIKSNDYGYYGVITKDKKFKVVTVDKGVFKDKRKLGFGSIVSKIVPKQKILDIIDHLNVEPSATIEIQDKEKFIDDIQKKTNKYKKEELEKMDDDRFKRVYYFYVKAKKTQLCRDLRSWFKNNKLMLYEKCIFYVKKEDEDERL